jgi:hypothetical protein
MDVQAQIPAALAALHNFILTHDPTDLDRFPEAQCMDDQPGVRTPNEINIGSLASGITTRNEKIRAEQKRDRIAAEMWEDYQRVLAEREMGINED